MIFAQGQRNSVIHQHFQTSSLKSLGKLKQCSHIEPFLGQGKIFFLCGLGHMTKMAAMPIYGKIPSNVVFLNLKAYDLETLYVALETLALQMFFKDHLALTLT